MRRTAAGLRRRLIRAASLCFFLYLLYTAAWPAGGELFPPDLYLRLDPLAAALVPAATRDFPPRLLPGVVLIFASLVFGRLFCGYLCPMGITLDLGRFAGEALRKKTRGQNTSSLGNIPLSPHWRKVKYLVLSVMFGAALAGVNLFFWASPLSLSTRFWALLMHTLALLGGVEVLEAGRPLFEYLDANCLLYLSLKGRHYETLHFVAAFFLALFVLERIRPRFWCRYLCPAGAALGLVSLRPGLRRRVHDCSGCKTCVARCPAGAIAPEGFRAMHSECIVCTTCVAVCPTGGSAFSFSSPAGLRLRGRHNEPSVRAGDGELERPNPEKIEPQCGDLQRKFSPRDVCGRALPAVRQASPNASGMAGEEKALLPLPSRRAFLGAGAAGVALAAVQYSGINALLGGADSIRAAGLLRPPGALPEAEFLDRCIRCGECMKACPTNSLQPAGFGSGAEGLFSPLFTPGRGPCEPDCNVCGRVCPTGAVRFLPLPEKQRARVGTAVVDKSRCVAWAQDRRCVVCEETCPYGSIKLARIPGSEVSAPVVDAMRCFGCGYCEHYCVTRLPSIVVEPLNTLRLASGSYREKAEALGYRLSPGARSAENGPDGAFDPAGDLPPGFMPLDEKR
ncbi:MAG: 4Fe-4S binding protein [Desulfovibrio sp.]|jgi:MauM/NapG family ferredoxin protein|nr:4Fe-4S binding protein [Desulfovibrio sp.]